MQIAQSDAFHNMHVKMSSRLDPLSPSLDGLRGPVTACHTQFSLSVLSSGRVVDPTHIRILDNQNDSVNNVALVFSSLIQNLQMC